MIEIERTKNENYKEKIKLEFEKTHNWVIFNEQKKNLLQKKKDLQKKLDNSHSQLDKKILLYKKN
jgi:hypothetical protein